MGKEREITIKVIENKNININRLTEFFTKKYNERYIRNKDEQNIKS